MPLPSRRLPLFALALVLGTLGPGCSKRRGPPETSTADEEVRPVYPTRGRRPPDPLARRVCDALHALPARARASCCGGPAGVVPTEACVRALSDAVESRAVRLDADEIVACEATAREALKGCDWVGPFAPLLPASCQGLLHGTLPAGARCRSSLECQGSLRCHGAGPTVTGVCGPPRPEGAACGLAVDTLATYVRADEVDRAHPECRGACGPRHRCGAAAAVGASCVSSPACGPEAHCAAGRCVAGRFAALGQSCTGSACEPGARCLRGRCLRPGRDGATCTSDLDCLGGCVRAAGATTGRCGRACASR